MSDTLRVILEVGKKRRVVAGATDWPGLDRWGTSEDDAIEKLLSYVPRYAGVAEGAGLAKAFGRARDVEVVERVPRIELDRLLGHRPRAFADRGEVLSPADLERRLDLLRACWAYFDETAGRVSPELRPGPRSAGRSRDQIIRHVYVNEPEQFTRKVEVRTPRDEVLTPDGLKRHRQESLDAIRAYNAEGKTARTWPIQFLVRRIAHHVMDHAWEMEDRDPMDGRGPHILTNDGSARRATRLDGAQTYFCFARFAFCCLGVGGLAAASVTWRNTLAIPGRSNAFCSAAISRSRRRARAASLAGRSSSVMPPGRPQACASAGAF